jgi:UPF0755 protein
LLLKGIVVALGFDHQIKTGEYEFEAGEPMGSLFYKMITGKVKQYAFKIIEGEDVFEIRQSLDDDPYLIPSELELAEGSLLPDTYFFVKGTSTQELVERAHLAQSEYLQSIWKDRASGLPWKSMNEVVIVASMLEKESRGAEERQKIAQVIVNRLKKNMRLQIDATAIYGLKDVESVRYKHIKIKNALNTYRMKGLPLHPICMPSRDSLYAALHPKGEHDILYYILMPDGSGRHHFSKTLSEHRKMKEKLKNDPR